MTLLMDRRAGAAALACLLACSVVGCDDDVRPEPPRVSAAELSKRVAALVERQPEVINCGSYVDEERAVLHVDVTEPLDDEDEVRASLVEALEVPAEQVDVFVGAPCGNHDL